jgi:hypothetical protein
VLEIIPVARNHARRNKIEFIFEENFRIDEKNATNAITPLISQPGGKSISRRDVCIKFMIAFHRSGSPPQTITADPGFIPLESAVQVF